MNSAYLYVRVSTDEQKRKGYSLIEQEDRLVKHCEFYGIRIKGIYREDYSAKDFNRPEWKKLIAKIRRNTHRPPEHILFMKWDRFSRNIEFAYQMIRVLRELHVQPMAIDQPIDLDVPESIVMLAVYLSIPEAENSRRGLTTSAGIRRARKLGKWPGKAPIGYLNHILPNGENVIIPKLPEADYIRWSFQQLATGSYTISQVRQMAQIQGVQTSRSNFWKLVHNPIYCGIIRVPATVNEEEQFVSGIHEPLISESLYQQVQLIITKGKYKKVKNETLKSIFPLRGFLTCPRCGRKLTASISHGKSKKYAYYHCINKCKSRFKADSLNTAYEEELKKIRIRSEINELFSLVLEDSNAFTHHREHIDDRKKILSDISKQEFRMSKARKLFVDEKIDFNDFSKLKIENNQMLEQLNSQLLRVTKKLDAYNVNNNLWPENNMTISQSYVAQDIKGKHDIISLFLPASISPITAEITNLKIDEILSLIVEYQK